MKKNRIWIRKASSHREAGEFERRYYSRMTREERIGLVQELRESYFKISGRAKNESGKRLRRVVKVVQ